MRGGGDRTMMCKPMPGETRLTDESGFLAMWVAMMGAMMMPSLVPTLARVAPTGPAPDGLAGLGEAGVGYFAVWAVVGAGIYVVGAALVAAGLRWPTLAPAIPLARGVASAAA